MATNPIVHELSGCSVVIRPDPTPLPYLPGATVTGHIALVARNEEGVRDVKHRLQVAALTLRYNWEARVHEHDPIYVRGGTTTISLIGGGEPEQVLLMPAAGPAGASQVEACFEFSFTLPEKGTVDFQSANYVPSSSGSGKARASPLPALAGGPPPTYRSFGQSSPTRSISHFLEAHLVFAGAGPEADVEKTDAAGFRIAGGDLDIVERTTIDVRADEQRLEIDDAVLKGWETVLPASGLKVQVTPAHLPLSASLTMPLVLNTFFHLPPTPTSPGGGGEKKKSSLLSTLTGGKGKERRREEEAAQHHPQHEGAPFVVEQLGGHLDIAETGQESVRIALNAEDVNIASQHPVLAHGLRSELHLDFAHAYGPAERAQLGSLAVPAIVEKTFLLSLWVKTSLVPAPQWIVERAPVPVAGVPVVPAPAGPSAPDGGWADYGAPPDGPPPPMDEPPTWGAAMGEGGSAPASRPAGPEDGPPPPGYM